LDQANAPRTALTEEARYRLLVEAVADYAIFMLDANGIVSSWNPGARRFKGYLAEEIIGQHFSRFYEEADRRSGLPQRALAAAREHGKYEAEGWRVRKDGSRFWAHVVIDPIRDPSGAVVGYAKITRDLTERRAAEQRLRRSEEQFRLLVQSVTDYAIYMLDTEGRVTSWNAGAERIKGYRPEEILGQHFSRFYRPEDRRNGEPMRALATAARDGRFESEGWRVRKDGTRFWANVVVDPVRDESGTIIGFAKVTRDVTERDRARQALESARESLFQSQKLDAIGQVTGGVAHDFNNLLMVVLSSLELLRRRLGDDARAATLIDNAMRAAQRGASLTQRMLAFARRQDLNPEPVDIAETVRGLSDLLQRSVGPTVTIETRFPESLKPVRVDQNQFELVLLNLTVNARDAMPHGGEIVISASEENLDQPTQKLAPGAYVCTRVSDNGEGMDEETLHRATEPFFTTKGVGKGTGLGLSMVEGLASQSGGRFVLRSRPGEGTTAELWLPVAQAPAGVACPPAPASKGEEGPRPLVILAVDDDALVLASTRAMLEDLGHVTLVASSAAEALQTLNSRPDVELLLTDHAMPQMTGAQLIDTIRGEHPDLAIVLATGYAELEEKAATPDIATLTKPFTQEQLSESIRAALKACRPDAGKRPVAPATRPP
jgi:PAS domain S-box-containing protein